MKIHPTALVCKDAQLADDVEVGAHAIIAGRAVLGAGCVVQANAVIEGDVVAGERNLIGYGCVIGGAPQDYAHHGGISSRVRIGSDNRFREYVTIHRGTGEGTETVIGDRCFLMVGAHLGHNVQIGNDVIITNNCLLAGHVHVQDSAVLGGGSVFHQHLRIGSRSMVAGSAKFNKDIPPFTMGAYLNSIIGLNAIGLRRAGFSPETRREIRRVFQIVMRDGANITEGVAEARTSAWGAEATGFLDFIASSKRGVATCNSKGGDAMPQG